MGLGVADIPKGIYTMEMGLTKVWLQQEKERREYIEVLAEPDENGNRFRLKEGAPDHVKWSYEELWKQNK